MSTIADFEYTILNDGSGRGSMGVQTSSGQIAYLINWSDLVPFVNALRGGWTEVAPDHVTFTPPEQHPQWTSLYVVDVSYEPIGSPVASGTDTPSHAWEYAKVTASFGTMPYGIGGGPGGPSGNPGDAVSEDLSFDCEVVTIPAGGAKTTGGDIITRPLKKITPTCDYRLTLNGVPTLPGGDASRIFGLLGKVNAETFQGAAAEKMMFQGARCSRSSPSLSSLSGMGWKIELAWKYRDTAWNKFYDNTGALVTVTTKDGTPIYDTGDFAPLLP